MGKRVLVLGSSFGGYTAAMTLKKLVPADVEVTVVSTDDVFTFIPSLPWVVAGWKAPEKIQTPVADKFGRAGVGFFKDTIVKLHPSENRAQGVVGDYGYDYVVIATGSELDFAAVPGMGPEGGNSYGIFSVNQALQARSALERAIAKGGGTLVFGNAQGASCLGPPYEMAMIADTMLRRKGLRAKFKIDLFTNEPFLGHFGVGGFGAMTRMLEDEFADRSIEWRVNSKIAGITESSVELDDGTKYDNDFSMIMPPFYGSHAYMDIDGLANPRGFILTDDYLANPKYPNVYAVGVSLAIAPMGGTAVPVGVPKTGQMTEDMAQVAARNIAVDIAGGEKKRGKDFSITCIADGGDKGFFISGSPLSPPRNKLAHREGRVFHYLKEAFEIYYMMCLRNGLPRLDLPRIPKL